MELVTASVTDTKEKPLHRQIRRIWKYKLLYVLLIPAVGRFQIFSDAF
jgi:putative aldouronate transport system permease protein